MSTKQLESSMDAILKSHLSKILAYDPFYNFPAANNKEDFVELMSKDPAFAPFGLASSKYVAARFGGNLITSLHRKLGDIYERLVSLVLAEALAIPVANLKHSIMINIDGNMQERSTDGLVRFVDVEAEHVRSLIQSLAPKGFEGIAFEVRSCYQIGDSKRIQADRDMALSLRGINLEPVMLVFCNTSLRQPTRRLSAYWNLKEGAEAFRYLHQVTGVDLQKYLMSRSSLIEPIMREVFEKF